MLAEVQAALTVTRREVRDQFRDWRIIIPILVLTLFFPGLMNFTAKQIVNFVQRYGAPLIGDRLIPFLLMVVGFFPISISLVIALESFVGEKERRSIEPLLCTPLENWQLYLGKLLAATAPPLVGSYLGIAVYLFGVYRQVGWKPELSLLVQILILTTVQAVLMVSGAVVISTQTTSVRAANLLASFIILPVAFLIQWESMIMFWGQYHVLWWMIFGMLLVSGLLVRLGIAHFNREELLGQEIDTLNLRWSFQTFWEQFRGQADTVRSWYQKEVGAALKALWVPMTLIAGLLIVAVFIGRAQANRFGLPPEVIQLERLQEGTFILQSQIRLFSAGGVMLVWLVNMRALLLATFAGWFTFGVVGIVLLMAPLMLVGYFMATLAQVGLSPMIFLAAFILPHGVLEIPAAVLTGAAILKMGARLVTPGDQQTIGQIWLQALADWAKIIAGLVIPLLLGAAILEVLVTPRVASWLLNL